MDFEDIKNHIYEVRGQRVMLDRDIASMYEVETGNLNRAVKRNRERFPDDFMFQLTSQEWKSLLCQIGRTNVGNLPEPASTCDSSFCQNGRTNASLPAKSNKKPTRRGGSQYLPYAFTEQGVAMLSGVLHSKVAVKVNIDIMRAFVAVRQSLPTLVTPADLADLKSRILTLESFSGETHAAVSDIRSELRNIYQVLDSMSKTTQDPPPPVGYQATEERRRKAKEK